MKRQPQKDRPAQGLYLHLPFCLRKCAYCDFTVRVLEKREQIHRYLDHLELELAALSALPMQLNTLYLGGGTPSLLNEAEIERLCTALRQALDLTQLQEWTLEVNPETGSQGYFELCKALGINRVSLGVQSFQPNELQQSGRSHSPADILRCTAELRAAGLNNISLDLIYGLPGQTLAAWQDSLKQALALKPSHLSLYSLEVHEKTAWGQLERLEKLQRPSEESEVAMYESACQLLAEQGFEHYEIANWSLPGLASQHNRLYWQAAPVLALGVGAHGYWQNRRYANAENLKAYYQDCQNTNWRWKNTPAQSRQDAAAERVILGLRLLQVGVDDRAFAQEFGCSLAEAYPQELPELLEKGLLIWRGDCLCLPAEAVLLSNEVFAALLEPQLESLI
ncbi:MAG: radical SAM family heme chaperone HemW [Candidatus Sericytochromatia bacterium]